MEGGGAEGTYAHVCYLAVLCRGRCGCWFGLIVALGLRSVLVSMSRERASRVRVYFGRSAYVCRSEEFVAKSGIWRFAMRMSLRLVTVVSRFSERGGVACGAELRAQAFGLMPQAHSVSFSPRSTKAASRPWT